MGMTCPACGSVSQDLEFCDHCNADLSPRAEEWPPNRCLLSAEETSPLTLEQMQTLERPESSVLVSGREGMWRAHWVPRHSWKSWKNSIQMRMDCKLQALPPIRLVVEETGTWVLAEASGTPAEPWSQPVPPDPLEDLRRLCGFLQRLAQSMEELHEHHLVWLNFDPREIEEVGRGARDEGRGASESSSSLVPGPSPPTEGYLRFTNLDLAVFPARQLPEQLQVLAVFSPPEVARYRAQELGPATDVFHLALFAYYWLAGLLPDGFSGNGLEAFGHAFPPLRIFRRDLPPGVAGVIARGLAQEPRHRFPSPGAFCQALEKVLRRNEQRWTSQLAVSWEIGGHSRNGRTKDALNRDNEDNLLVRAFSSPLGPSAPGPSAPGPSAPGLSATGPGSPRALLAVADGITTCEVGSGALASLITCLMLENAFNGHNSRADFVSGIGDLCRRAADSLLAWAIEKGYREQLEEGLDLMGTTLLAAWLEGNSLTLANVGDSRAYLIDGATVEQLTVDGDLGNELLAVRVPPEEVPSLGPMARGLRDCVGGCTVGAQGELKVPDDYCQPSLSHWPLLPGDVVVLCSDGLVEEGTFLEPEALGEIVRCHAYLPADELASRLADAADALQRLPSAKEPEGFGDNITCIVIRISKGPTGA